MQSGNFLEILTKVGLSLMKNLLQLLAKSVLIPLRLTAAELAADAGIHKILGSGATILVISNGEMQDVIKIVTQNKLRKSVIQAGDGVIRTGNEINAK